MGVDAFAVQERADLADGVGEPGGGPVEGDVVELFGEGWGAGAEAEVNRPPERSSRVAAIMAIVAGCVPRSM